MTANAEKKHTIDMCNGPILKKMLLFAVPLMFSSMLQLLFNAADVAVVGNFAGDNSLAAVGSTSSIINLLTNFFLGLSIGANVLVARYFGAKQEKDIHETVHTAMLLSVISGIIMTIVGCLAAKQVLTWMDTPPEVIDLSVLYLRIYFCGTTANMVYNFGSAILRAVGDTKRPLYYLTFAGVVNVALNLLFVIVFKMDVAGVALATCISQCISAVLVVICLCREQGMIKLELRKLHVYKKKFAMILRIGFPASLQSIIFSFSNNIIQASVNGFGNLVVAGNSAAANLEGFVYVSMNSFYQASLSFTSQNMGASQNDRIPKILLKAEICVITVGLVMGNLLLMFGEPLLRIYTDNPLVVEAGMKRLGVISRMYCLCGMMDVAVGTLRGLGYSVLPMVVSLIGACGLRLLWIFTFFKLEQFHSTTSLYMTYPVSWLLTFFAHMICFAIISKNVLGRLKNEKV